MIYLCVDCKITWDDHTEAMEHAKENKDHFVSGEATPAKPLSVIGYAKEVHGNLVVLE